MVNLDFFPQLEWIGHTFVKANTRRYFDLAVVGHHFYPEPLRLWSYGPELPLFCLCGQTSGGLDERLEHMWYTRFGYRQIIGGWEKK